MLEEDKIAIANEVRKPSGYAKIRLGLKLHPTQAAVLDSIFSKESNKTSFLAANSTGKTSSVIAPAIFYAIEMWNCNVVSTSASYKQLIHQLMPAIKKFSHLYPNWEFLENQIKINGKSKYLGFSTNDGEAKFQGFHANSEEPLLIIVDEAAGVHDDVFKAITRCIPTYLFVCGSPLSPEGVFYSIETEPNTYKLFNHFRLRQHDCLKENGWWLNSADINNTIQQYGPDNPFTLSTVYAEFASQIDGGLVSLGELQKCYMYPPKEMKGIRHVGIDFAAGNDANVVTYRNGNTIKIIKVWHDKDTMLACQEIANILNDLKEKEGIRDSEVSGDADGLGLPMIHRLKDLGWAINNFHGNDTPDINDSYSNKITECWIELAKAIKTCSVILPDNNEFKTQLLSRKQTMTSKGKLALEPKSEMRSRGIRSPDCADACAIAFSNPSSGNLTYTHKINIEPRKYSFF